MCSRFSIRVSTRLIPIQGTNRSRCTSRSGESQRRVRMILAAFRGRKTDAASRLRKGISYEDSKTMSGINLVESKLNPAKAIYSQVVPPGEPWTRALKKGQYFRIV